MISSIFGGIGDSNMPLVFAGIACVVNIIGDLLAAVFSNDTAVIARTAQYLKGFAPDASLIMLGLAAPCATVFGIMLNLLYFVKASREQ